MSWLGLLALVLVIYWIGTMEKKRPMAQATPESDRREVIQIIVEAEELARKRGDENMSLWLNVLLHRLTGDDY